jgi:hypothetical protein
MPLAESLSKPTCRCADPAVVELNGQAADDYAKHLTEKRDDPVEWTTEFECPNTGVRWLLDLPHSEYHDGGPSRLRRLPLGEAQLRTRPPSPRR